jgi:hypothetical protein
MQRVPQQQWIADGDVASGAPLHLQNARFPGMCLDADATNGGNGTQLQLWQCNGSPQQTWYFRGGPPYPGWSYQNGMNWPNGRCLDADVNAGWDGTKVQL